MGNLIRENQEENDPRSIEDVIVPSFPTPPQEEVPKSFSLPEATPEAQESLSNPGNGMQDIPAGALPELDIPDGSAIQKPSDEIIIPDYSPFTDSKPKDGELIIPKGMEEYAKTQEQKTQDSFLHELDTNSLQFLTSGETYPTLYEGATDFDISNLNQRALGLANKSFQQSRQENARQSLVPMSQQRGDARELNVDSSRNFFNNLPGTIQGAINWVGEATKMGTTFNPLAGAQDFNNSIQGDFLKTILAPITAIPMIAAQGKFGEQGNGWWGSTMYLLSLPDNIISGGLTDLHNIVTGNRDPKVNQPSIAQAVTAGRSYDFTQLASPAKPLAFIGSGTTVPKTLTELKQRSGLYKIFTPVIDLARDVKKSVTGNENITIPDFVFVGPKGKVYTTPPAKALQTTEAGVGFVADVLKGFTAGLGVGAIDNIFRSGRKVVQVVQSVPTPPRAVLRLAPAANVPSVPKVPNVQGTSTSVTRIFPQLITPPVVGNIPIPKLSPAKQSPNTAILAPAKQPATPITELFELYTPAITRPGKAAGSSVQVRVKAGSIVPYRPGTPTITSEMITPRADLDDLAEELTNAPIGTTVNTNALVTVERSAEELTEVAKFLGDIPPTRKLPLSRARLDELANQYSDANNPYKIHGAPIDAEAFKQPTKLIDLGDEGVGEIVDDFDNEIDDLFDDNSPSLGTGEVVNNAPSKRTEITYKPSDDIAFLEVETAGSGSKYPVDGTTTQQSVWKEWANNVIKQREEALAEYKPKEPKIKVAIDVPLPKTSVDASREIQKRWEMIDTDVPNEVKQQALYEIDTMYDNILDVPDLSDTAKLTETLRQLPNNLSTASTEGVERLQDMLIQQKIYEEAAQAEQVLKPQYINLTNTLKRNIEAVEKELPLGRQSALKAPPFEPSPVPPLVPKQIPVVTPTASAITAITDKQDLLNVIQGMAKNNDNYTPFSEIKKAHPDLDKETFTKYMYALEQDGDLNLSALVEGRRFSNEEQTAAIQQLSGSPLFYARVAKDPVATASIAASPKTYYHGSQVQNLDIANIDPLLGGSRNELGVGIYVTTDRNLARESAKAMPNTNLPPTAGREFVERGGLYEVVAQPVNPIPARQAPTEEVHSIFLSAVRSTQPDDVFRSMQRAVGKKPNGKKEFVDYFDALDSAIVKKLGNLDEVNALNTQRKIADGLRVAGYDAIDDGDMLVLLGGVPGNSTRSSKLIENVGTGSLIEGYGARFNVAQITSARMPNNKTLAVQGREAGVQLQTEFARTTAELYDDALMRADDAAQLLANKSDELEDFVRQEGLVKREERLRSADIQNRNQTKADSRPDTNHCI